MASDEGLNAYGAVTWGQFFVYQGFNDRAGWMHTSSNVDAVDEYLEKVVHDGDKLSYVYGGQIAPFYHQANHAPLQNAAGAGLAYLYRRCTPCTGR